MLKKILTGAILLGLLFAGSLIAEVEQVEERITYEIYVHTTNVPHFYGWVTDGPNPDGPMVYEWWDEHHVEVNLPTGIGYWAHVVGGGDEDHSGMQPFVDTHLYLTGYIFDPTIPEEE